MTPTQLKLLKACKGYYDTVASIEKQGAPLPMRLALNLFLDQKKGREAIEAAEREDQT